MPDITKLRNVLLVEDDRVDVMTIRRAMQELKIDDTLHTAGNGEEALEFLRNSENPEPDMILLDINMPRMNGIEFLEVAKEDASMKKIPVIVLTTSKEDEDRIKSFNLGVAGYMIKPVDYQQFVKVVDAVFTYWKMSELPEHN